MCVYVLYVSMHVRVFSMYVCMHVPIYWIASHKVSILHKLGVFFLNYIPHYEQFYEELLAWYP